jgi:hypothetical protein
VNAFLVWIPPIVSAVALGALWITRSIVGGGSPRALALLSAWFLVAGYLQFFGRSPTLALIGLVLQTALAIVLSLVVKSRA